MNKSDELTLKPNFSSPQVYIPNVASLEEDPVLYQDDDSVSTFNMNHPMRDQPSVKFTPKSYPPLLEPLLLMITSQLISIQRKRMFQNFWTQNPSYHL
jgi:hypothetical protein